MPHASLSRRSDGRLTKTAAKDAILEMVKEGFSIEQCLEELNYVRSTYEQWRRSDPIWAQKVSLELRAARAGGRIRQEERKEVLWMPFADFSERYLGAKVFPHMQNVVDLIEKREPSWLHPAMTYTEGDKDLLIVNVPPEHAKALALDTEVPTPNGWATIGSIRVGDEVFGLDGKPTAVVAKSEVFDKPTSRVGFSSGESFVASDDHLWTVVRGRRHLVLRTADLLVGDLLPAHGPLEGQPEVDLPLDPYLLGCWLGDGHTADGMFTTEDPEVVEAFAEFSPIPVRGSNAGRAQTYSTTGMYRILAELGIRGSKFVPEGYLFASYDQRMALLQGLMDTDGTISPSGQASFTSTNPDLARGVWFLASSFGLRPRMAERRATFQGRDCGPKWTIHFSPKGLLVFRLPRKVRRIRSVEQRSSTRLRRVESIESVTQVPTQCITVDNDSHVFLIGRSLIPTHNTMTVSINYATYATCMNPNIRGLVVSKTGQMSQKMLYAIKSRLTEPHYADLIRDFAPRGGFASGSGKWTQDSIYLSPEVRDSGEKDPSWQALGIGSQIYGARADLIILDDCVDSTNAHDFERQIDWIQSHVLSRLSPNGLLLIIGTRLAPSDLYVEIQRPQLYPDERSPWTYLAMPAVLEFDEDPKKWVTLWPRTNMRDVGNREEQPGEDGLYEKWSGRRLTSKRSRMSPTLWARVYQQQQVAEDTVFDPADVRGCINGNRLTGLIPDGMNGCRPGGMSGLIVVAGLDPATAGHTAMVAIGLDVESKRRYVLDVFNRAALKPDQIRQGIYDFTEKYGISEWVVETNGFQGFLAHDREVNNFLNARGCVLRPHHTGMNKRDADFGVSAMASLFKGHADGHNLIELPSTYRSEGVKALVEQLCVWAPEMGKHQKTDAVMALWMAELACLRRVEMMSGYTRRHAKNEFLTSWDRSRQGSVNLMDVAVYDKLVRPL